MYFISRLINLYNFHIRYIHIFKIELKQYFPYAPDAPASFMFNDILKYLLLGLS